MRNERILGAVGLGVCCLFPLVSLLQLRDTDDGWRTVAHRASASVVVLHDREGGVPTGCAVVLRAAPARAVMAGTPKGAALRSSTPKGSVAWRPRWVDPLGQFTLLEAEAAVSEPTSSASSPPTNANLLGLVPLEPAALHDIANTEESSEPVAAVLVPPSKLPEATLWVGELQVAASEERALYCGEGLRAVRDPDGLADVANDAPTAINPVLRGAPFVTRDGLVLALYLGERQGTTSAVPMALVRAAATALDRQTAR
jgi:hypothetical protein